MPPPVSSVFRNRFSRALHEEYPVTEQFFEAPRATLRELRLAVRRISVAGLSLRFHHPCLMHETGVLQNE